MNAIDRFGKRLDYIFAGSGDITSLNGGWVVSRARVGIMMRHPQLGCSLSDHFAVEGSLTFHPLAQSKSLSPSTNLKANGDGDGDGKNYSPKVPTPPSTTADPRGDDRSSADSTTENDDNSQHNARTPSTHIPPHALHNGTFLAVDANPQSPAPGEIFTRTVSTDAKGFDAQLLSFTSPTHNADSTLPSSVYDEILVIIRKYVRREHSQQRWRARHFWASVLVTVACLVAVWFSPHNFVAFILMLVSSLSLVAGTIDGLLALLFFKSELRALKEFEWEIMNAKAAVGGGVAPAEEEVQGDERGW